MFFSDQPQNCASTSADMTRDNWMDDSNDLFDNNSDFGAPSSHGEQREELPSTSQEPVDGTRST